MKDCEPFYFLEAIPPEDVCPKLTFQPELHKFQVFTLFAIFPVFLIKFLFTFLGLIAYLISVVNVMIAIITIIVGVLAQSIGTNEELKITAISLGIAEGVIVALITFFESPTFRRLRVPTSVEAGAYIFTLGSSIDDQKKEMTNLLSMDYLDEPTKAIFIRQFNKAQSLSNQLYLHLIVASHRNIFFYLSLKEREIYEEAVLLMTSILNLSVSELLEWEADPARTVIKKIYEIILKHTQYQRMLRFIDNYNDLLVQMGENDHSASQVEEKADHVDRLIEDLV